MQAKSRFDIMSTQKHSKSTKNKKNNKNNVQRNNLILITVFTALLIIAVLLTVYFLDLSKTKPGIEPGESSSANESSNTVEPSNDESSIGTASETWWTSECSDESEISIPAEEYEYIEMSESEIHSGELILVNNKYSYTFSDDVMPTVYSKKSDSYMARDTDVMLREETILALNGMLDDFYAKTNSYSVVALSCFRTYSYQEKLLSNKTNQVGAAEAALWVAKPGHSEHHTGYAVDLGLLINGNSKDYDGTGIYSYINENCYKYGFIVRYTLEKRDITEFGNEPWHFRYVGIPHAYYISHNNLCFEEYIVELNSYTYNGQRLIIDDGTQTYEVYTCNGTGVYVPKEGSYTVSGNNIDGFIVTVYKGVK